MHPKPKSRTVTVLNCDPLDEVQKALELILFAHIGIAADADVRLAPLGLNRTHHRILYVVYRGPGTTVGEVTQLLRLTPQAVQSAARRLIFEGFIRQEASALDGRKKPLFITETGATLQASISRNQTIRLTQAFQRVGKEAVAGLLETMLALIDESDADWLAKRHDKS